MKTLRIIAVVVTILLTGLQLSFNGIAEWKNQQHDIYERFTLDNDINFSAFIAPLQSELVKKNEHVVSFHDSIMFPKAEHFLFQEPKEHAQTSDTFVSRTRAFLEDSILQKSFNAILEIDGDSKVLYEQRERKEAEVLTQKMFIHLQAYASPEAIKYGDEAMLPGNIEDENLEIAQKRADFIMNELRNLGVPTQHIKVDTYERQLQSVDEAKYVQSLSQEGQEAILSKMRFVSLNSELKKQEQSITLIALPILLPLLILLAIEFLNFFIKVIKKARGPKRSRKPLKIRLPHTNILNWIGFILLLLAITVLIALVSAFLSPLLFILLIAGALFLLGYVLYQIVKNGKNILPALWLFFRKLMILIKNILFGIKEFMMVILLLVATFVIATWEGLTNRITGCWNTLPTRCWKRYVVFLHVAIMILFLYIFFN